MSYDLIKRPTIVVNNSPISFAVMGAGDRHRQVLIRSDDRNLDLVGLDNRTFVSDSEKEAQESVGTLGGFLIPDPRSFVVRTSTEYGRPVSDADSRTSHLSFAWRGLVDRDDLREITVTFSMVAADLMVARRRDQRKCRMADRTADCHVPIKDRCHDPPWQAQKSRVDIHADGLWGDHPCDCSESRVLLGALHFSPSTMISCCRNNV